MDESSTLEDADVALRLVVSKTHTRVDQAEVPSNQSGEYEASLARQVDSSFNEDTSNEQEPLLGHATAKDTDPHGPTDFDGLSDFDGLPWFRRPAIPWVLIPFGILAMAFGGILAPRINLIVNLVCREYYSNQLSLNPSIVLSPISFDGGNNDQCRVAAIQSQASQFNLYGNLIAGLLSAITSPIIGSLSDRYGRTRMIALTSVGSCIAEFFYIVAVKKPETFNMNWILLGFAFDGICGSILTAFAIVHAYVTDCVPPAGRSVAFAYFHACLFTGLAVGPAFASVVTKWSGTPVTAFYIMFGVHIGFMIFMLFLVPESLSKRRQERARAIHRQGKTAHPSGWIDKLRTINILEPLKILWPTGPGSSSAVRRNLCILAAIDTIMFGVAMGSMSVVLMYANYRFGWQTYESGFYMSTVNTFRVACLVLILPLVTRLLGRKISSKTSGADTFDLVIIRTAVFFDTLGYVGYALAPTGAMMTLSGVVASVGGIGSPTLQAALTKHVARERTGQVLGASGLLHALARVVAPAVCNGIYSLTVASCPQVVFVCLGATFGLAFALSWGLKAGVSIPSSHEHEDEQG